MSSTQKTAIFDLDGTIISGKSSEVRFFEHLREIGELTGRDLFRFLFGMIKCTGSLENRFFMNKLHYRGKTVERLSRLARDYFAVRIQEIIPAAIRSRIDGHKRKGDRLFLLSGSLIFIVESFAATLGFDDFAGTLLESENGIITGRIDGVYPRGEGKVRLVRDFIGKYDLDLKHSSIYGNSYSDRHILEMAGKPVAVNPDKNLIRIAREKGWEILIP